MARQRILLPVNARADSAVRHDFSRRVLGMEPVDEDKYWEDLKIKKGVTRPAEFGNPLKAVFSLKNAVGYVYRRDYKAGVAKIVAVVPL